MQVLRCVPDHPATCVAVAQCLASLGRHEEALKQLQRVLDAHPKVCEIESDGKNNA